MRGRRTTSYTGRIRLLLAQPALVLVAATACGDKPTEPPAPTETRSVSIDWVPTNGGSASGGGTWEIQAGQDFTTTLVARRNPGYDFDRWEEGGTTLSTMATYEMAVEGEHEVTAHFEVSPNPGEWGPGNTYTDYDFPGSGYESLAWTFLPSVDPAESLREKDLLHYYAYNFALLNYTPEVGYGYAGFQSDGHLTFGGRSRWGKVVNFSIWGSNAARTDGLLNPANEECGCHQIMVQYEWVEGRAYGFELREGPSGTEAARKWWGLWVTDMVTDSVTFIGEQRVPTLIDGQESSLWSPRTSVFGEDLHWWLSRNGTEHFVCSDFEPSSLAVLDVTAGPQQARPSQVSSWTNSGQTDIAENGYTTTICYVTVFTADNGDVQHNVGFWPEPPERVVGN